MYRGSASRGLQSPFYACPFLGHTAVSQLWPRTSVLGGLACRLGYDWEEAVRRLAPVLESGLKSAASGHPCPSGSVLRVLPPTWEALWAGGLTVWQVDRKSTR